MFSLLLQIFVLNYLNFLPLILDPEVEKVVLLDSSLTTEDVSSMIYVPDNINFADPATKPDSHLTQTFNILLESDSIPTDFPETHTDLLTDKKEKKYEFSVVIIL